MTNVLAKSVSVPHIKVFEDMFARQLANVDMSVVLMNMIDTCPADALPFLAYQFDVEGYKGMKWADTEQKQRDLIKKAIELHRFKGTRWAVAESLKVLGYDDVLVEDHLPGNIYDGTHYYNGGINYDSPHWAMFRVIIYIASNFTWDNTLYPDIITLVNEYKNVRSHLLYIAAGDRQTESVPATDDFAITDFAMAYSDSFQSLTYNGAVNFDGTHTFASDTDELTITIV
jgi:phage tail P2-like protein